MLRFRSIPVLAACLILLAAGCVNDQNPVDSPRQAFPLRPTSPPTPPALGDRVWHDTDRDGIYGDPATEPGLPGVTVHLFDCQADTQLVATTTTDASGYYSFEELALGEYCLHFELPPGFAYSPQGQGDDDDLDSDADSLTGRTECTVVDSGEVDLSWDVGMYLVDTVEYAAIGNRVWYDADLDGIQGDTMEEPGIEGIFVTLYTCQDSMVAMAITDTSGFYAFSEIPAGEYYLHFELPDVYVFSPQDQGADDMLDSDPDPMTGMTECFTATGGVYDSSRDAGVYMPEGGCTRSKGYWKNHAGFGPQADVVSDLLPIWLGVDGGDKSLAVTDAQVAVDVLSMRTYGVPSNGITKLYAQLLAAKLNMAGGASSKDIMDIVADADIFLAAYGWADWADLDSDGRKTVLAWMGTLDDYNNGLIGPGYCDDDDHDGDDN